MIEFTRVTALFSDLQPQELSGWIERGWVQPEGEPSAWMFQEIDVARVHLIHDLRRTMDVGEEAIPVVLSLLDQVYELRGQLRTVLRAVEAQPAEVRDAIWALMGASSEG
jgi:chaperone modulatory protein CbpM